LPTAMINLRKRVVPTSREVLRSPMAEAVERLRIHHALLLECGHAIDGMPMFHRVGQPVPEP
jgi:hypothetical protein